MAKAPSRQAVAALIGEERVAFEDARVRGDSDAAWQALMNIHIVSQPFMGPHSSSHVAMLRFAWGQRDWREVGGQLLRLALVPLGHLTGRLPVGNHGRARVNPFKPMPLPEALAARLRAHSLQQP